MNEVIALSEELFAARQRVAVVEKALAERIGDTEPESYRVAPRGRTLVAGAAGMFDDIPRPTVGATLDEGALHPAAGGLVPSDVHHGATMSMTHGLTERVAKALDEIGAPARARDIVTKLGLGTKEMKYVSAALTHLTNHKKAKKLDVGLFQSAKVVEKKRPAGKKATKAAKKKNGRR